MSRFVTPSVALVCTMPTESEGMRFKNYQDQRDLYSELGNVQANSDNQQQVNKQQTTGKPLKVKLSQRQVNRLKSQQSMAFQTKYMKKKGSGFQHLDRQPSGSDNMQQRKGRKGSVIQTNQKLKIRIPKSLNKQFRKNPLASAMILKQNTISTQDTDRSTVNKSDSSLSVQSAKLKKKDYSFEDYQNDKKNLQKEIEKQGKHKIMSVKLVNEVQGQEHFHDYNVMNQAMRQVKDEAERLVKIFGKFRKFEKHLTKKTSCHQETYDQLECFDKENGPSLFINFERKFEDSKILKKKWVRSQINYGRKMLEATSTPIQCGPLELGASKRYIRGNKALPLMVRHKKLQDIKDTLFPANWTSKSLLFRYLPFLHKLSSMEQITSH